MKKTLVLWSVVLVVCAVLGWVLATKMPANPLQQDSPPVAKDFEQPMRLLLAKKAQSNNYSRYRRDQGGVEELCLVAPLEAFADARSNSRSAMAWHVDFLLEAPALDAGKLEKREKTLQQLNALVNAGLLDKTKERVSFNLEMKDVFRYRLTEKGWKESGSSANLACFIYATKSFLGITGVDRIEDAEFNNIYADRLGNLEASRVYAKHGLRSSADLAPWAKGAAFLQLFPEISQKIADSELEVTFFRGKKGWVDSVALGDEINLKSNLEVKQRREKLKAMTKEQNAQADIFAANEKARQEELIAQAKLPPPSVDEIEKIIIQTHSKNSNVCTLYLPGNGRLPVDKNFTTNRSLKYAVAIFSGKERYARDAILTKTIPYLNELENLGILKKRLVSGIAGNGRDANTLYEAQLYEPTDAYKPYLVTDQSGCFSLGKPTLKVIDLQIFEASRFENPVFGMSGGSFSYKLRLSYLDIPAWAKDASLNRNWKELRGVVERGQVCEGSFGFDKKTRQSSGGSASCWWAFDSNDNGN